MVLVMKATVLVLLSLLSIGMSPAAEIFVSGSLPSLESLDAVDQRDAETKKVARLKVVHFTYRGGITGFIVERE